VTVGPQQGRQSEDVGVVDLTASERPPPSEPCCRSRADRRGTRAAPPPPRGPGQRLPRAGRAVAFPLSRSTWSPVVKSLASRRISLGEACRYSSTSPSTSRSSSTRQMAFVPSRSILPVATCAASPVPSGPAYPSQAQEGTTSRNRTRFPWKRQADQDQAHQGQCGVPKCNKVRKVDQTDQGVKGHMRPALYTGLP